jgi:hypothetical protein
VSKGLKIKKPGLLADVRASGQESGPSSNLFTRTIQNPLFHENIVSLLGLHRNKGVGNAALSDIDLNNYGAFSHIYRICQGFYFALHRFGQRFDFLFVVGHVLSFANQIVFLQISPVFRP